MSNAIQRLEKSGRTLSTNQVIQNGIIHFSEVTKTAMKERTEEIKLNNSIDIQNMQACQMLLENALARLGRQHASQEEMNKANDDVKFAFEKMYEIRNKSDTKIIQAPDKVLYVAGASFTVIACVLGSAYIISKFRYK